MFSIETDAGELLTAIRQLICILISAGSYPEQFWTLLRLENILESLYVRPNV